MDGAWVESDPRCWGWRMLMDVIAMEALEPYRLRLMFEDGVSGEVDLARRVRLEGVFAPLRDPASFRAVRVEPEAGTIVWPNGADLDPDMLHAEVTGVPVAPPVPASLEARMPLTPAARPDARRIDRASPSEVYPDPFFLSLKAITLLIRQHGRS